MTMLAVIPDVSGNFEIKDFIKNEKKENTIAEIKQGLSSESKYIPCRFFYDAVGLQFFQQITHLPEYYLSRTEMAILRTVASKFSEFLINTDIIELGIGDSSKISILFEAISPDKRSLLRYVPVDVSEYAVYNTGNEILQKYPNISVLGIRANFMKPFNFYQNSRRRLFCFFGSTLGNLRRDEALMLLLQIKSQMNPGDSLLLGLDLDKNSSVMERAYNDYHGITALFNKNILNVVNRNIYSNFDADDFEHLAYYNKKFRRIEMYLEAQRNLEVASPFFPDRIRIKKNETIHTENSHKYNLSDIEEFGSVVDLKVVDVYSDSKKWFAVTHYTFL